MDDTPRDPARDSEDLWQRAAAGDDVAWKAIENKYFRLLFFLAKSRITRGMGLDPEDIAQEALMRAWEFRDNITSEAHLLPWLTCVVIRITINIWRKNNGYYLDPLDDACQLASKGLTPEQQQQRADLERQIQDGVAKLPPKLREVVIAYLNDQPGTGGCNFHRARKKMAEILNEQGIPGKVIVNPYTRKKSKADTQKQLEDSHEFGKS